MIYITGDCHGEYRKLSSKYFPDGKGLTKNDYVIICGDFGYWYDNASQKWWFNWLNNKPWTTLFVDGNHENFDALNVLEVGMWHGGKVHQIKDSVFHLMRGQIFDLQGKKFFAFGGAASHDIEDGIIDPCEDGWVKKAKLWAKEEKRFRINHFSWWEEEMPNENEMQEGIQNLKINNNKVDYIITHDCPTSSLFALYEKPEINKLNRYFEEILSGITFKKWYFGHHHINCAIGQTVCLYDSIERVV